MTIPLLEKARNWAGFGQESQEETPVNRFTQQAPVPFSEVYPKVNNPFKLAEGPRDSVLIAVGLPNIGSSEIDLALSRIPAETNHVALSSEIKKVILAWRAGMLI
jgi:hypothetical protein